MVVPHNGRDFYKKLLHGEASTECKYMNAIEEKSFKNGFNSMRIVGFITSCSKQGLGSSAPLFLYLQLRQQKVSPAGLRDWTVC